MRKIVVSRPGGHAALALVEEADPRPGPGQVRVRVRAIGVNYADCLVRMGCYPAAKGLYPIIPGFEFSGVVEEVGPGVSDFALGERVFGISRFGAYASQVVADRRQLWPCPEGWNFEECAAFPAVYLTAYHGLFKAARVEAGETVLIHSAAGGVGTALLQLSRIAGLRAVAVVGSGRKAFLCRELGAAAVIDKSSQRLWPEAEVLSPGGYEAIFDANGLSTLREGYKHLAPSGRLVVYGFADFFPRGKALPSWPRLAWSYLRVPRFSPFGMTALNRGVVGFNVIYLFDRLDWAGQAMKELLGWIGEGRIKKVPLTVFPMEEAGKAHEALESGATTGKLVLTA
ncbi:MAG: zinc-binding dehydrogenase [Elusimicrobia bacterium]|nr:zinc-binding dehydrogenase [Elusimicrobiota bacterium]